jgi:uroporphyrinogen-III decarboxylase
MDDTIRVPTVLDAMDTVRAVNSVKIKLIVFTGTPLILAAFSSNPM